MAIQRYGGVTYGPGPGGGALAGDALQRHPPAEGGLRAPNYRPRRHPGAPGGRPARRPTGTG
jgi:hypothetical protein